MENIPIQTKFFHFCSEWAKYVSYWDRLLEIVEKDGVQKLDPTIDLFGPSVEEGEDNKNK